MQAASGPDSSAATAAPAVPATSLLHCLNCGAAVLGPFCAQCGQETRAQVPGVLEFFGDGIGRLLALDGRLWRTLYALLLRPGELSLEYLRGRRKHYVRPARLYFWLSLLLFAVLRFTTTPVVVGPQPGEEKSSGSYLFTVTPPPAASAASSPQKPASGATAAKAEDERPSRSISTQVQMFLADFDNPVARHAVLRLQHFRDMPSEDRAAQLSNGLLRFGPYALFALLPLFAALNLLVHLLHRSPRPHRPRRYVEHLVYAAHLHCCAFVLATLVQLTPLGWLPLPALLAFCVYVFIAQRRVYGGSWWASLLRIAVLGAVYIFCLAATTWLMLVLAMMV
ncbi:DUF3667 domain-containing protein [Paucibacter soli]|uniref:DUF3667 domain-containing protein n=1 Tax=Paucibacter soli TaxID=3133433 RepID=UPI0030AF10CD